MSLVVDDRDAAMLAREGWAEPLPETPGTLPPRIGHRRARRKALSRKHPALVLACGVGQKSHASAKTTRAQVRKPRIARTVATSSLDSLKLAELIARQGVMEIQLSRLRTDYEIQFIRIAQLQDELNTLKAGPPLAADALTALPPLPAKPTIES